MSEETKSADWSAPWGIIIAIATSALVGWGYLLALLFSIQVQRSRHLITPPMQSHELGAASSYCKQTCQSILSETAAAEHHKSALLLHDEQSVLLVNAEVQQLQGLGTPVSPLISMSAGAATEGLEELMVLHARHNALVPAFLKSSDSSHWLCAES